MAAPQDVSPLPSPTASAQALRWPAGNAWLRPPMARSSSSSASSVASGSADRVHARQPVPADEFADDAGTSSTSSLSSYGDDDEGVAFQGIDADSPPSSRGASVVNLCADVQALEVGQAAFPERNVAEGSQSHSLASSVYIGSSPRSSPTDQTEFSDAPSLSSSATSLSVHRDEGLYTRKPEAGHYGAAIANSSRSYSPFASNHASTSASLAHARSLLEHQAASLLSAARRLREEEETYSEFMASQSLVTTTLQAGGKLVWTGVGKSGIIAKKLCSTSLSLGLPATFLDPVAALHGDLGLVNGPGPRKTAAFHSSPKPSSSSAGSSRVAGLPAPPADLLIAISHSGSSPELLALLPHVVELRGVKVIALTAKKDSALGQAARDSGGAWLDCRTAHRPDSASRPDEGFDNDASPSTSTSGSDAGWQGSRNMETTRANGHTCCYCGSLQLHDNTRPNATHAAKDTGTDEADSELRAPTSSTTTALAMGDSLVLSCARSLGLGKDDFAKNHPGGALGQIMSPASIPA
ncbi:unnamed protein product [Parajaminaea phylloscopi]